MSELTICWFKRDLRIHDHPALAHAARGGAVLPVFIFEPEAWKQSDASGRHFEFLLETLEALRGDLEKVGLTLVTRVGAAVEVLEALRKTHGATRLVSHEETGNDWSFRRDRVVAEWARAQGVEWVELPQCAVVRRLPSRDLWQKHRQAFVNGLIPALPGDIRGVSARSDPYPNADMFGLQDHCPGRQTGGRLAAQETLASFLSTRGQTYRRAMSSPLEGAEACSRLSPHLALGALSIREVVQAGQRRAAEVKGRRDGWTGSMKSFQSRLAWRDHFIQKLEDEPRLEYQCLHPAYEGLRPATPDASLLAAWEGGQTGLPFLDACMRSLDATGWLNFRMRAMVMAVASYHLWLDWRATGAVLARKFTDYEPGIHWSQVQMQSGTTGMNSIRIYNPIKQGHDQDPTGAFTRYWLPELHQVPDRFLQEPWNWEGAGGILGRKYPKPIVDVVQAARRAREAVWAIRKQAGFRDQAHHLVQKHGSRKGNRQGIPRPDAQLSLDL
jgi:deoxyribodipyrimidine photo-lyase